MHDGMGGQDLLSCVLVHGLLSLPRRMMHHEVKLLVKLLEPTRSFSRAGTGEGMRGSRQFFASSD